MLSIRRILPGKALTRQQIWEMKRLWRMVPHVQCKGLCQGACTNVPLPAVEALYLIQKYDAKIVPAGHGPNLQVIMPTLGVQAPCQFLKAGRCSIYDDRPMVCRQYGHDVLTLSCGHGCKPVKPLPIRMVMDLMASLVYVLDMYSYIREMFVGPFIMQRMEAQIDELTIEVEED